MLDTLWTLLPFLASAALLIIWAGTALVVMVRWVIGQFQAGKIVSGLVALLMLLVLPAGSWLLGRSFFHKDIFRGADSKLEVLSGLVDQLFDGGKEKDASSSAASSEADSAPVPQPGDLSDEDLLALARQAYPEMLRMDTQRVTGELLPHDGELHTLSDASGTLVAQGYRVEGYATLEEVQSAIGEVWYGSFAHVSGQEAPFLENMYLYTEYGGAVYRQEAGIGGPTYTPVVDELSLRDGTIAYFNGHWDETPEDSFQFSLIFEDGRWKYGEVTLLG